MLLLSNGRLGSFEGLKEYMLQFLRFNSIRVRIFAGFLFLTLVTLLITFASLYMIDNLSEVGGIYNSVNKLQVHTLSLIKTDNDFFDIGASNEEYFKTKKSVFLDERNRLLREIEDGVMKVSTKSRLQEYSIEKNLAEIDTLFELYNLKFNKLSALILTRGFRDYGLEGEMRLHAHALENASLGVDLISVLSLRRSEKDFFLRHDPIYTENLNKLAEIILVNLRHDSVRYRQAMFHLREYKRLFNELVEVDNRIGMKSVYGLRHELNQLTDALSSKYHSLSDYSLAYALRAQRNIRIFYIFMMAGAVLIIIVSGLWISKRLSAPIASLSKLMDNITSGNQKLTIAPPLKSAAHEINLLSEAFVKLLEKTHFQMEEIESKSSLLKTRNNELKTLNRELDSFLYSTAHDLRSPLTSLLGLLRLAEIDNKQTELKPYFEMMRSSIIRQEQFIEQIVSYTKNKKLGLQVERIDLHQLIDEILQSHRYVEGSESILSVIDVNAELEFYSDKNRITILLNNLISNSIRYRDRKKKNPFIRVSAKIVENNLNLEFADNGIGIEAERLDRIFEMFYRASEESKGSGLGLFIFKETLQKLQGLVSVESIHGDGTKFILQIPNRYHEQTVQLHILSAEN